MNEIERLLQEEGKRLKGIEAPDHMEQRLRTTLEDAAVRGKGLRIRIVSLILAVLILGYNLNTLAFYGKKLIGYDDVMTGTLKQLNESGKGQAVGKSHTFKNGIKITIDGIMLDDNNLIMFYSLYSPKGNIDDVDSRINISISGIGGGYGHGGSGIADKDGKEIKWAISTNRAPRIFERTLKVTAVLVEDNNIIERAKIPFKIDRSQAVGKTIRMNIDKSIKLSKRSIKVKSLTASPTSTLVKGQIQNIIELGYDYLTENRIRPENIEMKLIANGIEIEELGSQISTDMKGLKFQIKFDTLPQDTQDLKLKLISFSSDHDAKEEIPLIKGEKQSVKVLGQDLKIDRVYEEGGSTYITITTDEMTMLGKVHLNIDGQLVRLKSVISNDTEKIVEKDRVRIEHSRTLKFEGIGDELILNIDSIRYNEEYNKIIYEHSLN